MPQQKTKTVFVCTECGYESAKWSGRCPDCGNWNTMTEESRITGGAAASKAASAAKGPTQTSALSQVNADEGQRYRTGIEEFDRVLGGGIVPGSAVLVCGDPGIGKSTLLLQMCGSLPEGLTVMYVSGEESLRQIRLRANRLRVSGDNVIMCVSTDTGEIRETIAADKPDIVIVDSIQTLTLEGVASSAGSVTQVRESAQLLISCCKALEIPLFLVGHVNKDGGIAGPKVLEHIVDTVLYFEGDRNLSYRILRAIKNRFGSTNEIGVFEMGSQGLREVVNPSEMLLSGRPLDASGTCITCLIEGTRPLLVELQALVAKSSLNYPRRVPTGFDNNRTALLVAVLEKRAGYYMGNLDLFINVAGGMRVDDPSADLAVMLAIVSNLIDKPVPPDLLALGEIGLAGEVRMVSLLEQRLSEGYRLGFRQFLVPRPALRTLNAAAFPEAKIIGVSNISQAVAVIR